MGSSGGAGSSGEVSWPEWISKLHKEGAENLKAAILTSLNPYDQWNAWNPNQTIDWMYETVHYFHDTVVHYNPFADWADAIDLVKLKLDTIFTEEEIDESVLAYSALLDDNIEQHTLPRFRAGMRDINAVQSTAFVIGESILEANKNREVAKYAADLRRDWTVKEIEHIMQNGMALAALKGDYVKMVESYAHMGIDFLRMAAVLKKEEHDDQTEYRVETQKWDMDNWTQYGNYIANMHGGVSSGSRKPSRMASAIGGAASGASMGLTATGGNPWGGAIGAVVGIGASMLSR